MDLWRFLVLKKLPAKGGSRVNEYYTRSHLLPIMILETRDVFGLFYAYLLTIQQLL